MSKKGGLDSLPISGRAWQERGGGVFEGRRVVDTPTHTMITSFWAFLSVFIVDLEHVNVSWVMT